MRTWNGRERDIMIENAVDFTCRRGMCERAPPMLYRLAVERRLHVRRRWSGIGRRTTSVRSQWCRRHLGGQQVDIVTLMRRYTCV